MKNLIIVMSCGLLLGMASAQAAVKVESQKAKDAKSKVEARCHVALADGSETIAYWRVTPKAFSKLSKRALNRKVKSQKSKKKVSVYDVYECVTEQDEFSSDKSKALDKKSVH